MEGQVRGAGRSWIIAGALSSIVFVADGAAAQDAARAGLSEAGPLSLRKSAQSREYKGQEFEGEDRVIGAGETLWRILVKDRGVPEARFGQMLVIIRGLNPQVRSLDVLRVGERIFIPLQPEDTVASAAGPIKKEDSRLSTGVGRGTTQDYRVKAGDHLYQVLREQLAMRDERDLVQFYALVKDLNPERKNWDVLLEGEIIRLPERPKSREITVAGKSASEPAQAVNPPAPKRPEPARGAVPPAIDGDYSKQLSTRENMALLAQVIEALGGELQQGGEEILALKDGTLRLDRASYPVVFNPQLQQKLVLDTGDRIPVSLKSRLSDASGAIAVVPVTAGSTLQDSVRQILSRMGYQPLPADRPVVIQQGGVAFEAKGHWVALGPERNDKAQEIFVINLRDSPEEVPEFLKSELARKGIHLKDILLSPSVAEASAAPISTAKEAIPAIKYWPRDKREFADALLLASRVTFGVVEAIKTQLRDGLSVEVRCDRIFIKDGKRTALFFSRIDPAFKAALQEREKIRVIEIDMAGLDHKDFATQLLTEVGHPARYEEHRFPIGSNQAQLQVKAWGFLMANDNLFITDRDIPPPLYRIFLEKGLEIVYF